MIEVKKQGQFLVFEKENDTKVVRYDLKNKVMERTNKRNGAWEEVFNQYRFFDGYTIGDLKFPDKRFEELILVVKKLNPDCKSISTFVTKIEECAVLESYIQEGLRFEAYPGHKNYYGRDRPRIPSRPLTDYDRNVIKFFKKYDIEITREFEDIHFKNQERETQLILQIAEANITREQMQQAVRHVLLHWRYRESFRALTNTHRFNAKSLLEYIYNYLVPFEGLAIDKILEELLDYCNMARAMGREVKKYPKYLRSMHDIIRANYNTFRQTYDENMFRNMMRQDLEYHDDHYCIVLPQSSKDVVKEGTSLNHCVSSYVEKILRGETYLCFLREVKTPEESLITVEVQGDKLVQARGAYNRSITEKERDFVKKFCKQRQLTYLLADA